MNPTNHSTKDRLEYYESKRLTLEEMDVLYRKCNQLHNEEIIYIIGRFFRLMKRFFTQNEMGHHHASPSK